MTDDRAAGYPGALPPREDRLARPWVIVVIAAFVLMFVLAFLGLPSALVPEPTTVPVPTLPPATQSVAPTESVAPSGSVAPSVSVSPSPSASQ